MRGVWAAVLSLRMIFSAWVARRIALGGRRSLSRLTVWMAVGSMAIGILVMEVSLSVTRGFQQQLAQQLVGFTGHVQIQYYLAQQDDSLRTLPLHDPTVAGLPAQFPAIRHITPYIQQDAMLKSTTGIEGIRTLGLNHRWDTVFFASSLVAGRLPRFPQGDTLGYEVLLGRRLARQLQVQVGQPVKLYFQTQGRIRSRTLRVVGLYETGFAEFDQSVILCHLGLLQRLLGLAPDRVQGFALRLDPDAVPDALTAAIHPRLAPDQQAMGLRQRHADLFQWLDMIDQTLLIIMGLMLFVAVLNMAAALMMLITERTTLIGILKALGASGRQVQRIFLWNAALLLLRGLLLGNALALLLLLLQDQTGLVQLDADSYYLNEVAVAWPWWDFLWLNIFTLAFCLLCMYLPARVAQRLPITRALRFR